MFCVLLSVAPDPFQPLVSHSGLFADCEKGLLAGNCQLDLPFEERSPRSPGCQRWMWKDTQGWRAGLSMEAREGWTWSGVQADGRAPDKCSDGVPLLPPRPLSLHHLYPRLFHSSLAGLPASTFAPYNLLQTQQPDWPWKPESHHVSPPQIIHWLIPHSESRLSSSRGLGDHPRSGHLCLSAPRPAETFQLLITPEPQSPSPHLESLDMHLPQDLCTG